MQSKDNDFVAGFGINFQMLRLYNKEWSVEKIIVFNHMLFRGRQSDWVVVQSIQEFQYRCRVKRSALKTIMDDFDGECWIQPYAYINGKNAYIVQAEQIAGEIHRILDPKEKNYAEGRKWLLSVLGYKPC